ncbi:MAG: flagellar hook-associated protein 3 [Treponema sp.]|jgi:flagellar hook-associated protein 3 FlgL|nr:flagellar hook-associated protein 3 [Treponema sp.]
MRRVATNMPNDDMQYYLRRQEEALSNMQSKMGSQTKINQLRDDPLAAAHTVRYQSYLSRLERFEQNTLYAQNHLRQADIYLYQGIDIMQRLRELAVNAANGPNSKDELRIMAVEVNELLAELVSISNKTGPDGNRLFSGDKAFTEPFRIVEGTVEGGGETMIVNVEYRGSGPRRNIEIGEGTYAALDIGGGEAFWAERMQIFSAVDATNWRADAHGAFYIDGVEISVAPGDTLPAIIAKINDSPAPVKAYMDPQSRGLVIEGTNPHLIRMEDKQGSRTLEELGMIQFNSDPSAPNWNPYARVSGGSLFDMVLRLRDAMFRGDQDFIGSQGIGGIDLGLANLETRIADIGSRMERAEMAWSKLNREIPNVTGYVARESGLDLTSAAMDLANMDLVHRAALQTAAKIIPPTLLDFLK